MDSIQTSFNFDDSHYFLSSLPLQHSISRKRRSASRRKPPPPKLFPCPYPNCGKRFSKKWNLQAHERLHTGKTPFVCRLGCGEAYMWMSSRKGHENNRCKFSSKNKMANHNSTNSIPNPQPHVHQAQLHQAQLHQTQLHQSQLHQSQLQHSQLQHSQLQSHAIHSIHPHFQQFRHHRHQPSHQVQRTQRPTHQWSIAPAVPPPPPPPPPQQHFQFTSTSIPLSPLSSVPYIDTAPIPHTPTSPTSVQIIQDSDDALSNVTDDFFDPEPLKHLDDSNMFIDADKVVAQLKLPEKDMVTDDFLEALISAIGSSDTNHLL